MDLLRRVRSSQAGLILAIILGFSVPGASSGPPIEEYQLKAAFLFNIAKFVEWPADKFHGAKDPIVLCVLGANPFGDTLEQAAHGISIEDRKFVVRSISDQKQTGSCHILFISSSERKRLRAVLAEIASSGILTVGDIEGFAAEGGVVNLKLEGDKVRIGINVEAAEHEKIRISSKLLSLAQIVKK